MSDKTWASVDFVSFLGLEKTLTPLEVEDLTNSLNREVLYRAIKDGSNAVPEDKMVETADVVKKEFILNYLKDVREQNSQDERLQQLTTGVIVNLGSSQPNFGQATRDVKVINKLLLQSGR